MLLLIFKTGVVPLFRNFTKLFFKSDVRCHIRSLKCVLLSQWSPSHVSQTYLCLEPKEKKKNTAFPLFAAWLWTGGSSVLSQTTYNSAFVFPACPWGSHRSSRDARLGISQGYFWACIQPWACTLHSVPCYMCWPFWTLTIARDFFFRLHISWAFASVCCWPNLLSPSLGRHEQSLSLKFSTDVTTNTQKSTTVQGGRWGGW